MAINRQPTPQCLRQRKAWPVAKQWLKERNIGNRIIKPADRNTPLPKQDKQFKRLHLGTGCKVERVVGVLNLHYGMATASYRGLNRKRTRFALMCVAHNSQRGLSIRQASCA